MSEPASYEPLSCLLASPPALRVRTLALCGELDIAAAPALERQLTDDRIHGVDQIMVDFSGVEFMDSAGLHALERACAHHRSLGRRVSFRGVPSQVARLFELAGATTDQACAGSLIRP
jgi:anti-anti-sigma factor